MYLHILFWIIICAFFHHLDTAFPCDGFSAKILIITRSLEIQVLATESDILLLLQLLLLKLQFFLNVSFILFSFAVVQLLFSPKLLCVYQTKCMSWKWMKWVMRQRHSDNNMSNTISVAGCLLFYFLLRSVYSVYSLKLLWAAVVAGGDVLKFV